MKNISISLIYLFLCFNTLSASHVHPSPALEKYYEVSCQTPSDIYEHLPVLKELTRECSSAIEIGVRGIVSTWSILQGLSENQMEKATYVGIDIVSPPKEKLEQAKTLAHNSNIDFHFFEKSSLDMEVPVSDLLFIDSLHTYVHLTAELEYYCDFINKYIALHDTSAPWGHQDEGYYGNYSEYPDTIDRSKRGLWAAVEDFLERHREWQLEKRLLNNHGFTILRRIN